MDGCKKNLTNNPPAAEAGDDQSAEINQLLTFDGSGCSDPDGDELFCFWDFGDGNASIGESAEHRYESEGEYIVTLLVTDSGGHTDEDSLTVTEPAIWTMTRDITRPG